MTAFTHLSAYRQAHLPQGREAEGICGIQSQALCRKCIEGSRELNASPPAPSSYNERG